LQLKKTFTKIHELFVKTIVIDGFYKFTNNEPNTSKTYLLAMKIVFLTVGKTIDSHLNSLQEAYQNRLIHYISFEYMFVQELKNTKKLSENEQKEKEADLLLKIVEPTDELILLDDKGMQFSSIEFANFLSKKMLSSTKRMIFVVGGPYGFSSRMYARAQSKLSLSAMTFSHQMVRLIFVEQLYRAFTIIKGEPYHHE